MGELVVGDALASADGRPSIVTGVYPQGEREIFRVTFTDGRSAEACAEHLWRVHYRDWPEPRVMSTAEVAAKLACVRYRGRLWIDMPSGDWGHDDPLPVDPWVLGALLGDGNLTASGAGSVRFSTAAFEMVERLRDRVGRRAHGDGRRRRRTTASCSGTAHHREGTSGVTPNPLMVALASLGIAGQGEPREVRSRTLHDRAAQRSAGRASRPARHRRLGRALGHGALRDQRARGLPTTSSSWRGRSARGARCAGVSPTSIATASGRARATRTWSRSPTPRRERSSCCRTSSRACPSGCCG